MKTKNCKDMARWAPLALIVLCVYIGCAGATRINGTINGPIKTIVVLVMENRSFDHILGWMKSLYPQINGVTGHEWNPISTTNPKSARVFFKADTEYVDPDPGHTFDAVRIQIFGSNDTSANPPPMNGFVHQAFTFGGRNMSRSVMSGFKPELVPVYKALINEFALFDHWFSSVPSETHPNRLFVHSATSSGSVQNTNPQVAEGYPQKTIFDSLEESGLSFGIYYKNIPATLFYKSLRKVRQFKNFHHYARNFNRHAKKGKLPNYVVVEPRYFDIKGYPADDDHPSHDVSEGQKLVKEVYETLRSSPQWNETLFIVTYDEHGGFYDHVPTPVTGVPSPDDKVTAPFFFKFDRLGVRVPTFMISPWIRKGIVIHGPTGPHPSSQFEHSSIPATVKKLFNLKSGFLNKRDAWAGTFEGIIQRHGEPRSDCPKTLPTPPKLRQTGAQEDKKMSEFQKELLLLAGILKGDNTLNGYVEEIAKKMSVREGNNYIDDAVKSFFEAARLAQMLGAPDDEIVKMRPALTTRSTTAPSYYP
eukprot:PITA_01155